MYIGFYVLADFAIGGSIIAGIVLSFVWKWSWCITVALFVALFVYPVLTESLINLFACLSSSDDSYGNMLRRRQKEMLKYGPVVYRSGYNLSAFGLERMHPFDALKYGR